MGSAFTTGLLVDIGLETSIPDTFCAPAPLPYDLLLGRPQCTDSESIKGRMSGSSFETLATCEDLGESDCKTLASSVILSPRKSDFSKHQGLKILVDEEEDCCPICFEGKKSRPLNKKNSLTLVFMRELNRVVDCTMQIMMLRIQD